MMKKALDLMFVLLFLSSCGKSSPSTPASSGESFRESTADESVPAESVTLYYDEIQPARTQLSPRPLSAMAASDGVQYYTVAKDALWGMADENGTELLPCEGEQPVYLCNLGHWSWWPVGEENPVQYGSQDDWDELSRSLEAITGYALCGGHGGSIRTPFVNTSSDDPVPHFFISLEGDADEQKITADDQNRFFGDQFFPVYFTTIEQEEIPGLAPDGYWNFADLTGNLLSADAFQRVGWFHGEALAPVEKEGKWAYINADGETVTDFVYDACWSNGFVYQPQSGKYEWESPLLAYELWGGFAPVCRNGKWGAIDSTGVEILPCRYEGTAPYPGGVWIKDGGCWKQKRFSK